MKKIDFKNKKVKILLVVLVAIIFIGGTYAYWRLTLTQTEQNELASACFDITISDEQNDINLQRAAPISDEEGMSLTPYTFTITNNCSTFASYSVNLELLNTILEANRLSAGFVKVMLDENTPTVLNTNTNVTPTLDNAYEAYELTTGYLDANASVTYNLRLWIDQDVTIEDDAMNKQLESKITITASYVDHMPTDYEKCVEEYGEDSIQCSIIADANDEESGPCPTVNDDGTVEVTAIEDTESLVCTAPDDYGTSYYYRGNVDNNWVKFAGYYWRILRVNGDGSIRMIYAGDADVIDALPNKAEVLANGYNDANTDYTQIGTSAYNSSYNDNAYVGYMYGTTGSSSYEETHANINDSTIKTVVDNWYKTNIEEAGYASYISDTLFCNDRSFASNNTGTGAGTSTTYYRWRNGPWTSGTNKTNPRLMCKEQNDRFTVSDVSTGNGDLTYPVGLLTTDEAALAGGYNSGNSGYYLYTGNYYWTMSPHYFNGSYARVRFVNSTGGLNGDSNVNSSNGVRPVLNLKSGSLTKGSGTALDPFLAG
ncbi:TPA: hypothetical protein IAB95_04745 [Candidatus Ventrenecus avicola]|nr:hypothetical protein [Candidatus Ventrenecus avicola]